VVVPGTVRALDHRGIWLWRPEVGRLQVAIEAAGDGFWSLHVAKPESTILLDECGGCLFPSSLRGGVSFALESPVVPGQATPWIRHFEAIPRHRPATPYSDRNGGDSASRQAALNE